MSVSTTRFFDNNSALFSKLNDELKSLQGQVGTGQADLNLTENIGDISKLSAAEEKNLKRASFWLILREHNLIWVFGCRF